MFGCGLRFWVVVLRVLFDCLGLIVGGRVGVCCWMGIYFEHVGFVFLLFSVLAVRLCDNYLCLLVGCFGELWVC